jgi:hypothetical protein
MQLRKLILLGTVLSLAATPVLAQGRGNSGGNANANVGGNANAGGVNAGGQSGVNGRFGGQSDTHVNAQGRVNSNGPNATDRDFGRDRAAERPDRSDSSTAARTNGNALGNLNAVHASERARANAAAGSTVGAIGNYETDMKAALAISNATQREAAITRARQQLAQTANKPLTSGAIAQIDSELRIQGASPRLGAER